MADPKTDFETNIPQHIASDPDKAKAINAIYLFKISGDDGGTWTVDLKDDPGVRAGETEGADCTIEIASEDWQALTANPTSGMQLYFQGKLKVKGNVMLATKLQQLLGH